MPAPSSLASTAPIASSSGGAASIARVNCTTSSRSSAAGSGGPAAARGTVAGGGVVPLGSVESSLIRLGLVAAASAASAGRFGAVGSRLVPAWG